MVAKFSACCLRASSTTSPAPGAIHWRRLPPISMLNSGSHESFDAAQMSAADHDTLADLGTLGLSLAESKQLLAGIQREIVAAQARVHAVHRPECRGCGAACR